MSARGSTKLALGILNTGGLAEHGRDARSALRRILALARLAERCGYTRFWLGEHHTPKQAESCPEVLLPLLAAGTRRIKLGTGGILLPYYSPLKVAETFRVLEALYPQRIELGVGRGPGVTSRNLALALVDEDARQLEPGAFDEKVADLAAYVGAGLSPDHRLAGVRVFPQVPTRTPLWLLAAGPRTMSLAAAHGLGLVVGLFLQQQQEDIDHLVEEHYRRAFRPSAVFSEPRCMIAVSVLCLESDREANDERVRLAGIGFGYPTAIVGDPARCRRSIAAIARRYRTDEALLVPSLDRYAKIVTCLELLAPLGV